MSGRPQPSPQSPEPQAPPLKRMTPMMAQYWEIKKAHQNAILLFRMGDFYETFFADAEIASAVLGITLTTRDKNSDQPIPLAGVPHHSIDNYIAKLLEAGHHVAVCEQIEDPALAKGLVKRQVTEVLTPGTALTPGLLQPNQARYALCLLPPEEPRPREALGYAFLDFSTGEFGLGESRQAELYDVVARFAPGEILLPQRLLAGDLVASLQRRFESIPISFVEDALFSQRVAAESLKRHFGVQSLAGLDCGDLPQGTRAAGALLEHGRSLKQNRLQAVTRLQVVRRGDEMFLDEDTLANLEIFTPLRGQDPSVTLVHQLDDCQTTMGSRLLRRWLRAPLRHAEKARARHQAVQCLVQGRQARLELRQVATRIGDLERLAGRIAADRASPRDLVGFADSLENLEAYRAGLQPLAAPLLQQLHQQIDPLTDLAADIRRTLVDEPPAHLRDGDVIRAGVHDELDHLLESTREARDWIAGLQQSERATTGIQKLKVGYNKVFGYYLEVPRSQVKHVPEHYMAKQTLVAAQRYITPELKEKEQLVLRADAERIRLENEIFASLRQRLADEIPRVKRTSEAVATVDVLASFAEIAYKRDYVCPKLTDGNRIAIRGGRHPVVERLLERDFTPNDFSASGDRQQILLVTGPNMGGKSTFLRQVALHVLMAYAGSFLPAQSAELGRVDRIFTRVGASDNLARGQSTFLVEMTETAKILNACTDESLVILDEVGRGTSTHDGMCIAWAILEYLHDRGPSRPFTLFATHYHELTVLAETLNRLHNLTVAVKEWNDDILFLHRVEPGSADKSYGIQVAKLAGLPADVIERASELLAEHEKMELKLGRAPGPHEETQLDLFAASERDVAQRLRQLALEDLEPQEALDILRDLRRRL